MFIAIEGINGSGKSTQTTLLEKYYQSNSAVLVVREPGGSAIGEKIRELLRHGQEDIHVSAQIALFLAARAQLAHTVVIPALNEGKVVITDRWITSTLVYQGYAMGGMSCDDISTLASLLLDGLTPDVTVILNVPVEDALRRRALLPGDKPDRYEKKGDDFQTALAVGYRMIGANSHRHCLVDGTGSDLEVHERIVTAIEKVQSESLL